MKRPSLLNELTITNIGYDVRLPSVVLRISLIFNPPFTSQPPQSPAPHNAQTAPKAHAQALSAAPDTDSHQLASSIDLGRVGALACWYSSISSSFRMWSVACFHGDTFPSKVVREIVP